jgi:hypothetical protein
MNGVTPALPYTLSCLAVRDEIPTAQGPSDPTSATAVEITAGHLKYYCTAFSSDMNTFVLCYDRRKSVTDALFFFTSETYATYSE